MFTKMLVAFAFVVVLLLGGMKDNASAHLSQELLNCPIFSVIPFNHAPKFMNTIENEAGFIAEIYDTNGDGKGDLAVYSALMDGEGDHGVPRHKDAPVFYEIDRDGDEIPDVLYIDPIGNQKCSDLVKYSDEERGGLAQWHQIRPDLRYDGRALVSN